MEGSTVRRCLAVGTAMAVLGLVPAAAEAQYAAAAGRPRFQLHLRRHADGSDASFDKWKFAAGTFNAVAAGRRGRPGPGRRWTRSRARSSSAPRRSAPTGTRSSRSATPCSGSSSRSQNTADVDAQRRRHDPHARSALHAARTPTARRRTARPRTTTQRPRLEARRLQLRRLPGRDPAVQPLCTLTRRPRRRPTRGPARRVRSRRPAPTPAATARARPRPASTTSTASTTTR